MTISMARFLVGSLIVTATLTAAASLQGGPEAGQAVAWIGSMAVLLIGLAGVDAGWFH